MPRFASDVGSGGRLACRVRPAFPNPHMRGGLWLRGSDPTVRILELFLESRMTRADAIHRTRWFGCRSGFIPDTFGRSRA